MKQADIIDGRLINRPKSWEYFVDNTYYKIGSHNFIFMWNNGSWMRSGKKMADLEPKRKRRSMVRKPRPTYREENKKGKVLKAIESKGGRTIADLLKDVGLKKEQIRGALKDLCYEDKIVNNNGVYSVPVKNSLFAGLGL
jgi:hypothetical protein